MIAGLRRAVKGAAGGLCNTFSSRFFKTFAEEKVLLTKVRNASF